MIIYLASYPRSGNSHIQTILFKNFGVVPSSVYKEVDEFKLFMALDPKFELPILDEEKNFASTACAKEFIESHHGRFLSQDFSFDDQLFLDSSPLQELILTYGNNHLFFLSESKDFLSYPLVRQYLANSKNLFVVKTHERPYSSLFKGEKILQIIRNPGAVFWSYLHFLKEYDGIETNLEEIILGEIGFGNWSQYQQLWTIERKKRAEDFCVVRYEDLASDLSAQIQKISDFIGLLPTGLEGISFEKMHEVNPVMVREGNQSLWEKNFTTYQLELIWFRHKGMMTKLGYSKPDFSLAIDADEHKTHSTTLNQLLIKKELQIEKYQRELQEKENYIQNQNKEYHRQLIEVSHKLDLLDQLSNNISDLQAQNTNLGQLNTNLQKQIDELNEKIEQDEKFIQELESELNAARSKITQNKNIQNEFESTIQKQETELFEKEQVIQQLATYQKSSIHHLLVNKLFPWMRKGRFRTFLLNKILILKNVFRPRIFSLDQYSPREFNIPEHYKNKKINLNQKSQPLVSIVTPSFNQADFLERTITSVLSQKYPNLEYIIQDGGSQDGSIEIIESYSDRLAHWESKPDKGQSHAINLGFEKTQGEIMAYLNSDDILLPDTIQYVINYFHKHQDVDVVYGHRVIIDEDDKEIGVWVLPKHDSKAIYYADYIPQETLFWRRNIWEKVGGIDNSFQFAMDWDMILRFQDAKAKFVRLPRFLAAFRVHNKQKTSHQIGELGIQEMRRLRSRYFDDLEYEIINKSIKSYIRRATLHHLLYRINILKY
jgi:glycosyltransferase involved in cell wall biosynthesis